MKPLKSIILALAATALTACSSDDSETTPQSQKKRPLTISVTENPFINPNDASVKGITTRSAVITIGMPTRMVNLICQRTLKTGLLLTSPLRRLHPTRRICWCPKHLIPGQTATAIFSLLSTMPAPPCGSM